MRDHMMSCDLARLLLLLRGWWRHYLLLHKLLQRDWPLLLLLLLAHWLEAALGSRLWGRLCGGLPTEQLLHLLLLLLLLRLRQGTASSL